METFSAWLALCAENSPVTGELPPQSQWRGALIFSLICAWINVWVNNREAGDLRCHRSHYDIIVMSFQNRSWRISNVIYVHSVPSTPNVVQLYNAEHFKIYIKLGHKMSIDSLANIDIFNFVNRLVHQDGWLKYSSREVIWLQQSFYI